MSTIPSIQPRAILLGKIWATCKSYRAHRENYIAARTLAELDDHILRDIGFSRCKIHSHAYHPSMDQIRRRGG